MEPLDSDIELRSKLTNDDIISAAVNLQMGQTRYQNDTFVVGSQITPYKKVQQALLELEARQHGYEELKYKHKLCSNTRKQFERQLKYEMLGEQVDELEIERLEIELEKALYDESLFEKKYFTYEREISEFCEIVRSHMDPNKNIEYYRITQEEEDRTYWITRMAKQAAVDVHNCGRIGSGNLDSILNMPPEDQLIAIKGAVEHATLLTAGVEKMAQELLPEVRSILEGSKEEYSVPELMSKEKAEEPAILPEVKNNVPREKFRIQSSRKPKT
ncbi:hypothetical protein AAJ61_gp095 [Synechococcus phage ACG-2014j]|uniref:Uncharacterized protein n=2 Tax=Potamoivirus TaxID=2948872 RepID=A0A1D8KMI8_9CAUD|nr:hypothetical protein AAJ61_gp095 [Synechococcus phage ACG-2014j]YP_009320535.1 hypothetical protein BOQ05_gp162 [Synechococcus phage S-CAM4]AIX23990.1 hypothetical protein Syn7803US103_95 [Synechococcus phage ACG-2014j]AOV59325.1 hypothetical protein C440309_102 [Synechococcus phage S-CAM4]AOV59563.1 hypothetical protein S330809_102 [Synechococcus phage S-CAM4]AOV59801.1 hypothetical protein N231010_102 [Synechococcus phage S-CAM4]